MNSLAGSLDTNVILRLLLKDVAQQYVTALELLKSTTNQFAVADAAIIETAFVLNRYYKFNRPQIAEAVSGLMSLTQINCNRSLFSQALPLYRKYPSLSFEDCCLAVYAELNGALPLWTFDKKLAKQAPGARLVAKKNEAATRR